VGDFFLAWPAFLALSRHYPQSELLWCGKQEFLPWLRPLGFCACPQQTRLLLDSLYSSPDLPWELENTRIFWFGVRKTTISARDSRVSFLKAVISGQSVHVRKALQKQLTREGMDWPQDWKAVWKSCFGEREKSVWDVLVFPGSGNSAKNWPGVKFFELYQRLEKKGKKVCFVPGPVEKEKGFGLPDAKLCYPRDLFDLASLIRRSKAVVGNDCGPMHLAGNFSVPGVELFGPTDSRLWLAEGMRAVSSPIDCAPCAQTARVDCMSPVCMERIEVSRVLAELMPVL
jgi:ADP-heptose:LPS heptosyltransferase